MCQNQILNENVWHLYYEKPDKDGYYLVQLEDGSHLVIKYLDGNWRCEKIHIIFYWCEIPNKPKHW